MHVRHFLRVCDCFLLWMEGEKQDVVGLYCCVDKESVCNFSIREEEGNASDEWTEAVLQSTKLSVSYPAQSGTEHKMDWNNKPKKEKKKKKNCFQRRLQFG